MLQFKEHLQAIDTKSKKTKGSNRLQMIEQTIVNEITNQKSECKVILNEEIKRTVAMAQ